MSKKHFIALADIIKMAHKEFSAFNDVEIQLLADFCQSQNSNFKRDRWLSYIKGECGSNGGKVKS